MRKTSLIGMMALTLMAGTASAEPVLLVSIDGLRPHDVIEAEQHGLKIPTLRKLLAEGAYATGVKGVIPTITSPGHITLITGVSPARHGIHANAPFDPEGVNARGYYNYTKDIKVATLWDVVHRAGGKVASIAWPASSGARSIDYNIADFQPALGRIDNGKLMYTLATPGLPEVLESLTGENFITAFTPPAGDADLDQTRARFGAALLRANKPKLMTFHFSSLDGAQHEKGAGTPEAHASLEGIDKALGLLVEAARQAQPDTVNAITSDHGFANITHRVNLLALFVEQNFLTLDAEGKKIASWDAMPGGGPIGGVILARPEDMALRKKVKSFLEQLQHRPEFGIQRIVDTPELAARGAPPLVTFIVDFKPGYVVGGGPEDPLVTPSKGGAHGYFPEMLEMNSTFIITGTTLTKRGSLGEIDMRDIAPTLAEIMGVKLTEAEGKPLFSDPSPKISSIDVTP